MKLSIFFAWYDCWIGWFYNREKRALYICLLPTIVCKIERREGMSEELNQHYLDELVEEMADRLLQLAGARSQHVKIIWNNLAELLATTLAKIERHMERVSGIHIPPIGSHASDPFQALLYPISKETSSGEGMSEQETITITFKGNKKFKQMLVDRIYELLMEEDFLNESAKPGCGYTLESSIVPTEVQE